MCSMVNISESRVGKRPITIPDGVKVGLKGGIFKVDGPKGSLSLKVSSEIGLKVDSTHILVVRREDSRRARSLHGLTRTLISNMIKGVTEGFQKRLELSGIGYKAEVKGDTMMLSLGYSSPVKYELPKGVSAKVEKQTSIILEGVDKQAVGQTAAEIRSLRMPEPYKGKGIKYFGEHIKRKVGKAGAGIGTK